MSVPPSIQSANVRTLHSLAQALARDEEPCVPTSLDTIDQPRSEYHPSRMASVRHNDVERSTGLQGGLVAPRSCFTRTRVVTGGIVSLCLVGLATGLGVWASHSPTVGAKTGVTGPTLSPTPTTTVVATPTPTSGAAPSVFNATFADSTAESNLILNVSGNAIALPAISYFVDSNAAPAERYRFAAYSFDDCAWAAAHGYLTYPRDIYTHIGFNLLMPDDTGATIAPTAATYLAQGAGPVLGGAVAGVNIKPVNKDTSVCAADFWKPFVSGNVTITGIDNDSNFAQGYVDLLLIDGVTTLRGDFRTGTCLGPQATKPGSQNDTQVCYTEL